MTIWTFLEDQTSLNCLEKFQEEYKMHFMSPKSVGLLGS